VDFPRSAASSRLEPSVPTESFAGPDHLARIQQEARKVVDSALNAFN
jgi:phosphoglucomutase